VSQGSLRPGAAILLMIGGLIIIAGSAIALLGFRSGIYASNGLYNLGLWNLGTAAICGIVVFVSAIMVKRRPYDYEFWGAAVFIGSTISLLGQGGFFIGAILGIVGSIMILGERN